MGIVIVKPSLQYVFCIIESLCNHCDAHNYPLPVSEGFDARGAITHIPRIGPQAGSPAFSCFHSFTRSAICLSTPHPATADEIHTRLRGAHSHNATAVYNNSTCPAVHIRGSAVLLNAACRSVKCLIASLKFQRSNPIKDDVHVTDISDSAKGCMHVQW
jgi:hypothetical protein